MRKKGKAATVVSVRGRTSSASGRAMLVAHARQRGRKREQGDGFAERESNAAVVMFARR